MYKVSYEYLKLDDIEKNDDYKQTFICEDYFPITIAYNKTIYNDYIYFQYGLTNLLELNLDLEKKVNRILLTICNEYEIFNENININNTNLGYVYIDHEEENEHINLNYFKLNIYSNGFEILLKEKSELDNDKMIEYEDVIYSIDSSNNLTSIKVLNLSKEQIEHIKKELVINE